MGLSIIGGSDHSCVPFGTGDPGIFISKACYHKVETNDNIIPIPLQLTSTPILIIEQIIPGGAAARTGKLRMGDRILEVNDKDIRDASHETAVMALLSKADEMKLRVQHDPLPSGFQVTCDAPTGWGWWFGSGLG